MGRLSKDSNRLPDKLMSTLTEEKCRGNKRLTSTILSKSQHQASIRKDEVEFELWRF